MARLLWVIVVYFVHISLAMSKSSSPIRTRLRENITGYRSRYSLHRGQVQTNVPKSQNVKNIEKRDHDRITKAINQQDQAWNSFEEDVKRLEERGEDGINWNKYIPPVLMMALNQQDQVKNGLEVNDVKTTQQREVDIKGFNRVTKAINQQDQAWNSFEEDVKRLEERDEDGINWNNYIPPVLMMALNQQDEKKSRYQFDNDQSDNIDLKYQAILMMALSKEAEESSLLQEDSNQDINESEVDTNNYKTIMMSVKPNPQGREKTDIKEKDATTKSLSFLLSWLARVRALRTALSNDEELYFNDWVQFMDSLKDCSNKGTVGRNQALAAMGLSDFFLDIFWPFRHDANLMNQRLAVSGFEIQENKGGDGQSTKTNFIKGVENMLGIYLPVKENQVILSFDDEKVVEELVRTHILNISDSFKSAGKHLFQDGDKQQILKTANEALKLINETSPDLYKSIVQMVAVIAFYRDETSHFTGGTGPSLVGIIWLNPVNLQEWTVPFMAEQIVHEFTHNSLFSAELVHGMYRDGADLSTAQPISAIRHEQRDFDRCLHAAYVSASLITFHTRIGQFKRAHQLAETLTEAVLDLNSVNAKADVLDASGRGMLQFLNGYMCLMRL